MTTIGRIRIKGVRGIRAELPIDLDGRSLLLRGDNGTGKSSIAQALRWALTGALTSPTAEPLPEAFQRHQLDTGPADCEVTIDLLPKGKIAMKAGKVDDLGTDQIGHAYVSACIRSNPFLRRDELLGFLTYKAAERFKYLEKFLELDRAEHIGSALVIAAKKHAALASEAEDKRRRLVETAAAALPREGAAPTSGDELRRTLFARAAALGLTVGTATDFDGLTALRARITVKAPTKGTSSRRGELANAIQQASALAPPDHPRTVLDPLREAEARALETELANVLAEAIAVVEKQPSLDSCPVCEQPVEAVALLQRLRERVALLTEVRTHARRANGLGIDWCRFLTTLDTLERVASASAKAPEVFSTGRALLHELEQRDGGTLSARVLSRLEVLRSSLKTKHDEIPDDIRASDLGTLGGCIDRAIASRGALEGAEATFARHTRLARELQVIAKAVGDARKDVAEEILESIGGLVASYYEHIHPPDAKDEVTGAPSIEVKRHGGGTAHVRGTFNKVAIDDPRHIYSDGHLDTVGICVFLALRKRSESDAKLLVLDDVVLSIDLGHAGRLVRLLRDEFKDHQILVFSHNELFMRMCRSPLSGAKDLAIVRWSLERGPQIEGRVTLVRAAPEGAGDFRLGR